MYYCACDQNRWAHMIEKLALVLNYNRIVLHDGGDER
jgi:hypothetical protein